MKKSKRVGLLTKIIVAVLSLYIAFNIVSLQIQINNKRAENATLQVEVESRKNVNDQIKAIVNGENSDGYIADTARNILDYITPGEKVFVDISSK